MIDSVNSLYIHAAGDENFQSLVLDNSVQGPVLVNFWSRKAGPCLRQYPVLDQLVHEYDGKFLLVNVDADAEISVTKDYGIASVPTLKLFRQGRVVETLHGYQSREELKIILDRYVSRESDLVLAQAIEVYAAGEPAQAYERIAGAIVEDPNNPRLPLTMCKLLKHEQRYAEAIKLIDSLPEKIRMSRDIDQLYDTLSFCNEAQAEDDIDNLCAQLENTPDDMDLRIRIVANAVCAQQFELALQQLSEMIGIDLKYNENYAQKSMLRIFNILGEGHELIGRFRAQLLRYTH